MALTAHYGSQSTSSLMASLKHGQRVSISVSPWKQAYPWSLEGHAKTITNALKETTPRLSDYTENIYWQPQDNEQMKVIWKEANWENFS